MEKEAAKQKFSIARSMYMEGQYEEALALLDKLGKEHPAVFNIEFRMLQCLMQLGRLEEVKELFSLMVEVYKKEGHQEKLRSVQNWIKEQEGGNQDELDGLDDLKVDLGVDALGVDLMGDLFDTSASHKKNFSSSSSRKVTTPQSSPWKLIAMGVVVVLLLAGIGAGVYLAKPELLGFPPQFSADVVLGLPFANLEGKFYRKSTQTSRTELMGQVVISKNGNVYRIIPGEKKYSVSKLEDMVGQTPLAEMSNFKEWISKNNGKITGEETLYGFLCDVYEAQVRMSPSMPPADTKIWYARDLKFPVKSETMTTGLMGKVVMFLKNINVAKVPDDIFNVPSEYTKTSVEEINAISRRMGLGGERPIGDRPPGLSNAPDNTKNLSPAEMKRLMEEFKIK